MKPQMNTDQHREKLRIRKKLLLGILANGRTFVALFPCCLVFSVPSVFSVFDLPLSVFICVHLWFHSRVCQGVNSYISPSDRISAPAPQILNARSPLFPVRG